MSRRTTIKAKGKTDRGSVRTSNQDSVLVNDNEMLFIVADGMGGHAGGEVASQLCITQIPDYLHRQRNELQTAGQHPNRRIQRLLAEATNFASTKIYEKALENPMLRGMGTTATTLKIVDDFGYIGHVGDSRLYLIRCGYIYKLTDDHSLVSEQIRAGLITEDEAQDHHLRNVITRSVGYQEEEDVDVYALQLEDNDFLLLCSDGLHGKISDREICKWVVKKQLQAVDLLIDTANDRGGEDNITCIIVHVQQV